MCDQLMVPDHARSTYAITAPTRAVSNHVQMRDEC